jgi:hypothetical protein
MRVEACIQAYRMEDRRQRFADRRAETGHQPEAASAQPRAAHAAHQWFQPAFGAHILGQIAPEAADPTAALNAYTQPETRTPLRPYLVSASV